MEYQQQFVKRDGATAPYVSMQLNKEQRAMFQAGMPFQAVRNAKSPEAETSGAGNAGESAKVKGNSDQRHGSEEQKMATAPAQLVAPVVQAKKRPVF